MSSNPQEKVSMGSGRSRVQCEPLPSFDELSQDPKMQGSLFKQSKFTDPGIVALLEAEKRAKERLNAALEERCSSSVVSITVYLAIIATVLQGMECFFVCSLFQGANEGCNEGEYREYSSEGRDKTARNV